MRALGCRVRVLREPGGTKIGEEIRHTLQHSRAGANMSPETELLLLCASRAQLVREIIRPALDAGEIVLCDRFYDSTVAYQGYGRGLDLRLIRRLTSLAVGRTRPALTILLAAPAGVGRARLRKRAGPRDRMEAQSRAFFQRVQAGYEAVADSEPRRVRRLDAAESPERVARAVWDAVAPWLRLRARQIARANPVKTKSTRGASRRQ